MFYLNSYEHKKIEHNSSLYRESFLESTFLEKGYPTLIQGVSIYNHVIETKTAPPQMRRGNLAAGDTQPFAFNSKTPLNILIGCHWTGVVLDSVAPKT